MQWCYECYLSNKKPKGIVRKIIYGIWLEIGIRPSKLFKIAGQIIVEELQNIDK